MIDSGSENTQNTWMDAKYGDIAVTPRNGKAVEINALWYNALKTMETLSNKMGKKSNAKKYNLMAKQTKLSFENKFYNKRRKCLYDVLGDPKIRPNQLFSLSLTYPVIDPDSQIADQILDTVKTKLLNAYGLKTLAKGEEGYVEIYEGEPQKRDFSYHQGITWPWLLGIYQNALKNRIINTKDKAKKKELQQEYEEFLKKVTKTYSKSIYQDAAYGTISEIYDSKSPFKPRGTISQGWSVSEILRIILEEKKVNNNENTGN
mgnify:CR=1 FL=1